MSNYHIEENENRLKICWRCFAGRLVLPIILMIALVLLLGYCWLVPGMMTLHKAIQNPNPGMTLLALVSFAVCGTLTFAGVFLLCYKESLVLDRDGLILSRKMLCWSRHRHISFEDLHSFDYSLTRQSKGRITYSIQVLSSSGEYRFGMGWSEGEMKSICERLTRNAVMLSLDGKSSRM